MMVDRTPEIATPLRQKPAAEGPIQRIGRHNATKAALDVLRDHMETLQTHNPDDWDELQTNLPLVVGMRDVCLT
jgi:hypothetical protein